jgi:hypothetical protein
MCMSRVCLEYALVDQYAYICMDQNMGTAKVSAKASQRLRRRYFLGIVLEGLVDEPSRGKQKYPHFNLSLKDDHFLTG